MSESMKPRSAIHRARIILDAVGRAYPDAWAQMERFRALRGSGLPRWPEWCYAPLAAAYAIVSGGGDRVVPLERAHHIGIVGAMAAWRMGQQIIRYDPVLYESLVDTPVSGELPTSLLYRLPAWCLYLETPGMSISGRPLHGVWVHLDWSEGNADELRLLLDQADDPTVTPFQWLTPMPIILGPGTVADALQRVVESGSYHAMAAGHACISPGATDIRMLAESLAPILSLVLYLCSEEPDWSGAPPSNPRPKRSEYGGWRLLSADNVRVWDVGTRLGAALRMAYHAAATSQSGVTPHAGRERPRAHIRRAHWHTFLAGVGRTERRLKWLPPIPVNVENVDTMPATVRPVK